MSASFGDEPHYGVLFPTMEIGTDPEDIRRYAVQVQALGFDHLVAFDHVVGADDTVHRDLSGPFTVAHPFHEPLVLFGFLAGVCGLELATGVLVLPQRQTVLVAKQAAEVDLLSGGRLRLGVGIGWNHVESTALGADFHTRGRRIEEQIEVLRRCWGERVVTFRGADHDLAAIGLVPRPRRETIPVWMGTGSTDVALERVGRLADGWIPRGNTSLEEWSDSWGKVRASAERAGRDPDGLGVQGLVFGACTDLDRAKREIDEWRLRGATHIAIDTMGQEFSGVDAHLDALDRFRSAIDAG